MEWISDLLTTIAIFAAALLILVFVHELGHFLAAKAFRMRVDKFSIGFPPKIIGFKAGETEYSIGATPLGGFVKIAGMIDESMDTAFTESEPQPWEYRSKPVWQRMVVITAGVIFNMILAVIIYMGMAYHYGDTVIPTRSVQGLYIAPDSYAFEVGFREGDRITGVNGKEAPYFQDLFSPSVLTSAEIRYMVERDGDRIEIVLPADALDRLGREGLVDVTNLIPSVIGSVAPGSPAEAAGLLPGDRVVAMSGEPVGYWLELRSIISASPPDRPIEFSVERDGGSIVLPVSKEAATGMVGIQHPPLEELIDIERVEHSLASSFVSGLSETGQTFTGILKGLGRLFSGSISVRENLGGPVAIANITREATEAGGFQGFWNITAFLSITLAIMNMLPIPVLDGGHFVFLLYEAVTRREPSVKVRMTLQQIGFILLVGLFVLVTFNDILRVFGG